LISYNCYSKSTIAINKMKTLFNVASIVVCTVCFTFSGILTFHVNVFNNHTFATKPMNKNGIVCARDSSKDSIVNKASFDKTTNHKHVN
jgi:hypothetical protein